ncbi:glycoside hydrolase family 3 N-terminal domain-containing protein [Candidatus Microthrix parvicella]|jgi:beta-N-acetylhexosaminidase|nr:glycoside hydrolase family 3 N-terminal domain-containing protein [Candidatus Microthrix parvicella]
MLCRRGWLFVCVVLLAAGCGGGEDATSPQPSQTTSAAAETTAEAAIPTSSSSAVPSTTAQSPTTGVPATSTGPTSSAAASDGSDPTSWPLRQKLAQLLLPGFNAGPGGTSTSPSEVQALIDAGAGGVFVGRKEETLFASSVLTNARANTLPPFVATDGEGGQVDLLPSIMEPLPPAGEMAAWDTDRIRAAGASRGTNLAQRGVTVDFAPVLDVAGGTNPLGDRTWSAEPDEVVRTAGAFAEGLCSAGVLPTFKHFPGHGRADAHGDDAPARTPDLAAMEQSDLLPFKEMIASMGDRSLLMTGHLDVPGLTDGGEPFSLNPEAMKYLRDTMGYDGVTVTDELAEMGAITKRGISVPNAVEMALVAGNDMALYFGDVDQMNEVLDHLETVVAEGRLSEARVDRSLARILALKSSGACASPIAPQGG